MTETTINDPTVVPFSTIEPDVLVKIVQTSDERYLGHIVSVSSTDGQFVIDYTIRGTIPRPGVASASVQKCPVGFAVTITQK